jgi:NAD+ kinase
VEIPPGSRVRMRAGTQPVRLARLSTAPFTDRLVRKFSLPVHGWRDERH